MGRRAKNKEFSGVVKCWKRKEIMIEVELTASYGFPAVELLSTFSIGQQKLKFHLILGSLVNKKWQNRNRELKVKYCMLNVNGQAELNKKWVAFQTLLE